MKYKIDKINLVSKTSILEIKPFLTSSKMNSTKSMKTLGKYFLFIVRKINKLI